VIFTAKVSLTFLVAVTVLFYCCSGGLIRLFIAHERIIAYGTRFLRGMCLGLPFIAVDFLGVATFQSCGKGLTSLIMAFLRKIVLEIPALIILNHFFPLYGLAYAQTAAEVVMAFVAVFALNRMFRKV
jgi:Na+-driven multidrug efflux pump